MPQNSTKIINNASLGNYKTPRQILPGIFAFAPNRDTLGATSYFIVDKSGNILVDCPAWNDINQEFIAEQGGIRYLVITHRGGMGKNLPEIQTQFNCLVIVQEQEAYLLPEVQVTTFTEGLTLEPDLELIWTAGHSPGSTCIYSAREKGILFTGRHLLPTSPTTIAPLRTAKTFHWWRQLNNIAKLRDRFSQDTLQYILPGANTGYLRGKGYIDNPHQQLTALDLTALRSLRS